MRLPFPAVPVAPRVASLTSRPAPRRLGGPLHLRLLASLVADVTNCGPLRATLTEREATLASLAVERQKEVCSRS